MLLLEDAALEDTALEGAALVDAVLEESVLEDEALEDAILEDAVLAVAKSYQLCAWQHDHVCLSDDVTTNVAHRKPCCSWGRCSDVACRGRHGAAGIEPSSYSTNVCKMPTAVNTQEEGRLSCQARFTDEVCFSGISWCMKRSFYLIRGRCTVRTIAMPAPVSPLSVHELSVHLNTNQCCCYGYI